MLNIKALLSRFLTTPIIVEQGTNGIWTYRKWSNGVQECWGIDTRSFAMTNAITVGYYGNAGIDISLLNFKTIQNCQITGGGSGGYHGSKIEGLNTSTLNIGARSSYSYTINITHHIYLRGTWK